jgi:hypothetical protein
VVVGEPVLRYLEERSIWNIPTLGRDAIHSASAPRAEESSTFFGVEDVEQVADSPAAEFLDPAVDPAQWI